MSSAASPDPTTPDPVRPRRTSISDDVLIRAASEGPSAFRFATLKAGHDVGYKARHQADFAFCVLLAFHTDDVDQIVRIWEGSQRWAIPPVPRPGYARETAKRAIEERDTYRAPNFRAGKPGLLKYADGPVAADVTNTPSPPTPPPPLFYLHGLNSPTR